jgi:predicted nucleic acid-binding protein
MRVALDTNVLVYAEGINDDLRRNEITGLLRRLPPESIYLPVQALAELFYVLVRRGAAARSNARSVILEWRDQYGVIETSQPILLSAMELACQHSFSIWDAIIVSAAASADCRLLLSEDLQHGFTWSGVTVVNPFAKLPHELLVQALEG